MEKNEDIILAMLEEIDRARSGSLSLEELEERLWRLREGLNMDFPQMVASRVENFVQEIREKRRENLRGANPAQVDQDQGVDALYNEIIADLGRVSQ